MDGIIPILIKVKLVKLYDFLHDNMKLTNINNITVSDNKVRQLTD